MRTKSSGQKCRLIGMAVLGALLFVGTLVFLFCSCIGNGGKNIEFPMDFSVLLSLYYTIFLGIVGIYFAVLAIFLNSRTSLSVKSFFKYTANGLEVLFSVVAILCMVIMLLLPYFEPTKTKTFYFSIGGIMELFLLAVVAFERLLCLENPRKCAKAFST